MPFDTFVKQIRFLVLFRNKILHTHKNQKINFRNRFVTWWQSSCVSVFHKSRTSFDEFRTLKTFVKKIYDWSKINLRLVNKIYSIKLESVTLVVLNLNPLQLLLHLSQHPALHFQYFWTLVKRCHWSTWINVILFLLRYASNWLTSSGIWGRWSLSYHHSLGMRLF